MSAPSINAANPHAAHAPHHGSGPVVWAAIIAGTCLLLLVFQKVLWLVVPFLLALILYYFLYPLVRALIYRGMSRNAAASLVTLAFLVLVGIVGVALMPRMTSQLVQWQDTVDRYVQGGAQLLDASLRSLEGHWPPLARARLADTVAARLAQSAGSITDHLEPVALGIMAWTPSLLLAPFLAFFFLRDGRRFKRFLGGAVPNAFFERTLFLLHEIDRTARAYFQGLINLTILDTVTLAAGLWLLGIPGPLALGLICAVLAWVPYVGSILGGLLVVLVAATDFPGDPSMAYWAIGLFGLVRLLDDFVYMPMTIGKSLELHPLITVLMIFAGGAVAGVAGLMLVLPVLGVVMVIGETIGLIVTDPRLMARHRYALALRQKQASADL
jgi:predicted PurR-regulated permease PerM